MKNKIIKISLIVVLMTLIAIMATSCNLFDGILGNNSTITKADVEVVSGLEKDSASDIYYAEVNKKFTLSIDWHKTGVVAPKIEWHLVKGEVERDEKGEIIVDTKSVLTGETSKKLEYKFNAKSSDTYNFYAVVSSKVVTNVISVKISYASLSTPIITSSLDMSGGVISQLSYEKQDIDLAITYNKNDIDPSAVVNVDWHADDTLIASDVESIVYDANDLDIGVEMVIRVEIYIDEQDKQSAQVTLIVNNAYSMIDDVDIEVVDNVDEVVQDTFYMYGLPASNLDIDLSISIFPSTANIYADCTWSVEDKNGERILGDKDGNITLDLTYGKNVVSASVENVESSTIIIYVLQYDYIDLASDIKNAIEDKFVWRGDYCDRYINNDIDLENVMGYFVSLHNKGVANSMYVAEDSLKDGDAFMNACSNALSLGNDESGSFKYSTAISASGYATITFSQDTVFGIPSGATTTDYKVEQANNFVRFSEVETRRESLPIDSVEKTLEVVTSNDLYRVVSDGYKPIFANTADGNALKALYDKAREVLFTYIDESMSELDKVAVIHDWIVNEIDYDYKAAELVASNGSYNAFYLEGVFNDKRAVCDGKSKAFALLCGMEGIRAIRIVGVAGKEGEQKGGHAWNKVLVDTDSDNVREWYVVDTTWDDTAISRGNTEIVEYLNYAYYLVSDEVIANTHESTQKQPAAVSDYDVFSDTIIQVGSLIVRDVKLYVENTMQFERIMDYCKANGNMSICVYLKSKPINVAYTSIDLGNDVYVVTPA